MNLRSAIDPCNCWPYRRLRFADDKRNTVDNQQNVEAFLNLSDAIGPLIRDGQRIVGGVIEVDQSNLRMLIVDAEWHRLLVPEPRRQRFIRSDQAIRLN